HAVDFPLGSGDGYAGLEAREHRHVVRKAPVHSLGVLCTFEGEPQVDIAASFIRGGQLWNTGRHDPDDRARLIVEANGRSVHGEGAVETILPKAVAEDGNARRGPVVIAGLECTAERGLNAHHGEETCGNEPGGNAERSSRTGEVELVERDGTDLA